MILEPCRAQWRGALATSILLSAGPLGSEVALAQPVAPVSDTQARTYHIAAQALGTALQEFAAQAGVQMLFSQSDVAGMKTDGLQGTFSREQALQRLLAGSGLAVEYPTHDSVIIRRPGNSPDSSSATAGPTAAVAQTSVPTSSAYASGVVTSTTHDGPTPSGKSSQSTADFEEVIVTGRAGVEQRTKEETSYSVTTIDQERLRLQGPTSVTESLKSVPGFWVKASGGEERAAMSVRVAFRDHDGFGSITLLEDGMAVQNDPALGYLNADQAFRLDETIDRIEVVRGGPSSIFYSNSPAGAVNFIPRSVGDHAEGRRQIHGW